MTLLHKNSITFSKQYFKLQLNRIVRFINSIGIVYIVVLLAAYVGACLFLCLRLQKEPFYITSILYPTIAYFSFGRKTDLYFLKKTAPISTVKFLMLEDNILLLFLFSPWVIGFIGTKAFLLGHTLTLCYLFFQKHRKLNFSFKFPLLWLPFLLFDFKKILRTSNFLFFACFWLVGFFVATKGWVYLFYLITNIYLLSGIVFLECEGKEILFANKNKWLFHYWKANILSYLILFTLQFPFIFFSQDLDIKDYFAIIASSIGFIIIYLSLRIFHKYSNYEQGRRSKDFIMPFMHLLFALAFPIGLGAIYYYLTESLKQIRTNA